MIIYVKRERNYPDQVNGGAGRNLRTRASLSYQLVLNLNLVGNILCTLLYLHILW